MRKSKETLRKLAELERLYPKRTPEQVATAMLQGWAFLGQSREDHDFDHAEIAQLIKEIRSGK